MIIRSVEVTPFVIPLNKPTKWAAGYMTTVDWLLVKIIGDDGSYGVAEAIPRPMIYGETQHSIYYAITQYLAPLLVGEDSFALENIWSRMGALACNPAAKSAIDIALHDLNGKLLKMPVHRLLGGPARTEVDLVWMVGLMSNDQMLAELDQKVTAGFRTFKIKAGLDPDNDIRLLKQMRERVPDDVRLYIDANMRYDKETAYRVLKALEDVLDCVEEPMLASDDLGRRELAQKVAVPMLGDESVFTVADVCRQIQLGALKRISIKMPRTGFWLSRKIVHLAEAGNLKLQINTQSETTLGTAACLQLAAAYGQISLPSELTFYLDVCDSLITSELTIDNGKLKVPDGPGMGVDVDWDKLKKYAVKL
ncbi:L-alanine-DL-glutamate epimerase-like enolase superfamily enzyme [Paraburkholderia sp. BL27I4N3]|uniref:mandelate racemase/muconate lactonizing enzyme family protein n=1 Tax=Paraburkholderia sp. BL27I4N3 TaxID=1938805 RepID=UPI000E225937|nr:mandelate racemase/muconate lactonizing enzyme family protein [Paraburkholderia sp. BL27I4N3]REE07393.1 L-alanine-DL-glutamate epimerase-like enolase superfamily enzyme [Paraburkholderia sp. BL27I4N3]